MQNEDLVDIRDVRVDADLPKQEKIREFIRQIRDPYRYKCGKYTVTACFPEEGPTIEDCLQGLMV